MGGNTPSPSSVADRRHAGACSGTRSAEAGKLGCQA